MALTAINYVMFRELAFPVSFVPSSDGSRKAKIHLLILTELESHTPLNF